MQKIEIIDIANVKQHSGLSASAIRFYEEKGLIQSIGRKGLRRLFSSDVLVRLDLIALGRLASFSLDEIAEMFSPSVPKIDRNKLLAKANELDKKIKQLTAMRDTLRHTAHCPESNHFECPTFQGMLRAARKIKIKKQNIDLHGI